MDSDQREITRKLQDSLDLVNQEIEKIRDSKESVQTKLKQINIYTERRDKIVRALDTIKLKTRGHGSIR